MSQPITPARRAASSPRWRRFAVPLLAGGLTALVLPWSSASAGPEPAFTGYTTSAWSAPVKMEFYEPTIPIPADPQFELEMAYTRVESETGLSRGRGSWLWPGDPVGEGAKTFAEALGLPDQVGEQGYPVQVNSVYPTGPEEQKDEPFPGMVMRTSADEQRVGAQVGYSPDGEVQDPQSGDGDSDGGDDGPGLPTGTLEEFGDAITGAAPTGTTAAADEPGEEPAPEDGGAPGLPPELAALVDFTGYTSQSEATASADEVATYARAALGDVRLLGGIVTIEGIRTRTVTTSDGERGTADGSSALGAMSIGDNAFTLGPDGIEAQGEQHAIPGLPDEPKAALAQLGLELTIPEPLLETSGDSARSLIEGVQVVIDTRQLRQQLAGLPLNDLIGQIPGEAKDLRGALQAIANLSPRIVITLGNAGTATDTVLPLDISAPTVDPVDTGGEHGDETGAGGNGGDSSLGTGSSGGAAPGAPADAAPGGGVDELTDAAPMADGLPPLNSIPGALTVGGIVLAAAAGSWLRKIGAIALGGVGSCPHGLDSGLPDLRKA